MIFFPEKDFIATPADYGYSFEEVWLRTRDGVKLHGWYLTTPEPKGALLFLHGNAGNISGRLEKAGGWLKRGFAVFLLDYRGYGKSEGHIEIGEDIVRDGEAGFHWLTETKKLPAAKIIFYGESLGTYPAIRLAAEYQAAATVLEAPFTSFVELGRKHYGGLPGLSFLLKNFRFANLEWIEKVKRPVFVLHGWEDETCPYAMGEEIFKKIHSAKELFSIPGGGHNNLPEVAGEDYWDKPYEFVKKFLGNTNLHE